MVTNVSEYYFTSLRSFICALNDVNCDSSGHVKIASSAANRHENTSNIKLVK